MSQYPRHAPTHNACFTFREDFGKETVTALPTHTNILIDKEVNSVDTVNMKFGKDGVSSREDPVAETQQMALCHHLRQEIVLGHLNHGHRITEKFVAERMNVKRGPARECLLILEGQGLIRKVPSLGYFVQSYNEDEIRDAYDVRIAIETLAVRRAARETSRESMVRLRVILEEEQAAFAREDVTTRVRADMEFHHALVRASGSVILDRAYQAIPRPIFGPTAIPPRNVERIMQQHQAILDAVSRHDADAAVAQLVEHVSEHGDNARNGTAQDQTQQEGSQ